MKHIKKIEDYDWQPSYNIGDKVICIFVSNYITRLKLHDIYTIEDSKIDNGNLFYKFYDVSFYYSAKSFRLATPEQIEKYELEKNQNKYNL